MFNGIVNFNWRNVLKKISVGIPLVMLLMTSMVYAADNTQVLPNQNISTSKISWSISFWSEYDKTSINSGTLYLIQDSTGAKLSCTYNFIDDTTVIMNSVNRLKMGGIYSVIVTSGVKSADTGEYLSVPAKKTYTVTENLVIDTVLASDDVSVLQNNQPVLPSTVDVLYKDGSIGKEPVTWASVSTSTAGLKKITGRINGLTITTSINVNVTAVEYVKDISLEYYSLLGIYSVNVQAESSVSRMSLNGVDMYYNGNDSFQLNTLLTKGSTVTFNAYDSSNKLLGFKKYTVQQ
ncbi:Ig-like domain-containing protein [Clostridium bowmanii]|uniref:Ig-like domain-containing protein n=1 Tax=Clostridium bowmanii TaxID=132925 RepID=UPI001C0A985A|nr:Ig-like domain-containing protein [Clostridium bowmanii]MBU3190285.1 Ig-like domain-containing protein [Clostridium bowmanii]MCA1072503.1 Ig-like domain-containing protein [Clostridium bowmanii]